MLAHTQKLRHRYFSTKDLRKTQHGKTRATVRVFIIMQQQNFRVQ